MKSLVSITKSPTNKVQKQNAMPRTNYCTLEAIVKYAANGNTLVRTVVTSFLFVTPSSIDMHRFGVVKFS